MAFVDPRIARTVAHVPEVVAAVANERDRIAHIAEGLFASHDNPGGHEITTSEGPGTLFGETDSFVNLDGPAPLALELGHWTPDHKKQVEGIHVLGRAIAQAAG